VIGQDIDISRVDWQPVQGEGGAAAHGPLSVSDRGESLKRPTPCRNWTIHAVTIRTAPHRRGPQMLRTPTPNAASAATKGRRRQVLYDDCTG
jgi:hypothetical protein